MNYLAHFQLAWPDRDLVAGALEGDYHKGPLPHETHCLADGIRLHRFIDAYTDGHLLTRQLRAEFPPHLRRFAGILIDLGFDHFLTRHWRRYSELSLPRFKREVYATLDRSLDHLSPPACRMAWRLREYDILGAYHHFDSVAAGAERIGERFKRGNPLRELGGDLHPLAPRIEEVFLDFYPELLQVSRGWRERGPAAGGHCSAAEKALT